MSRPAVFREARLHDRILRGLPVRLFDRYASFIPDFEGFQAALRRPMPTHIRVNTLRMDPGDFERSVRRWGGDLRPLRWYRAGFEAPPVGALSRPGTTLEYFLGLYHVQGASSMVPPLALEPKPGERVLDLCAAPGSKTSQIGELMRNEGFVLANDLFVDRLKVLKAHLERLGIVNACISHRSGESFPGGGLPPFQRVLVDAPCSGEGTVRGVAEHGRTGHEGESEQAYRERREAELGKLHRLQRALLRRAANLVEPGGVVVYATCTYSPLENEAVIDDVLRARDDLAVEELPVDVPGAEPGLRTYEGTRFRAEVARARRLYPHRAVDSAGFFICRLRRKMGTGAGGDATGGPS